MMADNTQAITAALAAAEQRVQMLRAQLAQAQSGGAKPMQGGLQQVQPAQVQPAQVQPAQGGMNLQQLAQQQAQLQQQQAQLQQQRVGQAVPGLLTGAAKPATPAGATTVDTLQQQMQAGQALQQQQRAAWLQPAGMRAQAQPAVGLAQPAAGQAAPAQPRLVMTPTGMQPAPFQPNAQQAELLRMKNMQAANPGASKMQLDMLRRANKSAF